jgi:short-subunit dehydrogenase
VFTKPEIVQYTKKHLGWFGMKMAVPPERVGEIAVRNTLRGKMMIIPGTLAKISSSFIRILPRRWVVALLWNSCPLNSISGKTSQSRMVCARDGKSGDLEEQG